MPQLLTCLTGRTGRTSTPRNRSSQDSPAQLSTRSWPYSHEQPCSQPFEQHCLFARRHKLDQWYHACHKPRKPTNNHSESTTLRTSCSHHNDESLEHATTICCLMVAASFRSNLQRGHEDPRVRCFAYICSIQVESSTPATFYYSATTIWIRNNLNVFSVIDNTPDATKLNIGPQCVSMLLSLLPL